MKSLPTEAVHTNYFDADSQTYHKVNQPSLEITTFAGHKVSLMLLRDQDASELFELVNWERAHWRPCIGWVDGIGTRADTIDLAAQAQQMHEADAGWYSCIRSGSDHDMVGMVWLEQTDGQQPSLGFGLAQHQMGRGIVSACVLAACEHAFSRPHVASIQIKVANSNIKAKKVAQRLGFSLDTADKNQAIYRLSRAVWAQQVGAAVP